MQLLGQDFISQTPRALGNEDVFLFGSLACLPKKHGKKIATSGLSCFVFCMSVKMNSDSCYRIVRVGITFCSTACLHRGGGELTFVEINYLLRSSNADRGA